MTQAQASKPSGPAPRLPMIKLDPGMYDNLGREEVGFLKDQTGIEDEEELKRHVLAMQNKAWDVSNKRERLGLYAHRVFYRLLITFVFRTLRSYGEC